MNSDGKDSATVALAVEIPEMQCLRICRVYIYTKGESEISEEGDPWVLSPTRTIALDTLEPPVLCFILSHVVPEAFKFPQERDYNSAYKTLQDLTFQQANGQPHLHFGLLRFERVCFFFSEALGSADTDAYSVSAS